MSPPTLVPANRKHSLRFLAVRLFVSSPIMLSGRREGRGSGSHKSVLVVTVAICYPAVPRSHPF